MMTFGDLVSRLGAKIDGFNLLEVVQYLRESKLARKVGGVVPLSLISIPPHGSNMKRLLLFPP